jgi:hypothetical protein
MIKSIPLSKLIPSPRNVRRSTDEQADLQLKADIEARGLLQNLVVAPANKPRSIHCRGWRAAPPSAPSRQEARIVFVKD